MQTEVEVSLKSVLSTLAVIQDYLAKGGTMSIVDDDALIDMLTALGYADRIVIKKET
jgi:hypothetical protein